MVVNPNYIFIGGRPVRDPKIFVNDSNGNSENKCAVFTLAVNRIGGDGEQQADYISCRCYGKNAETCEKYIKRGTNIQCHGSFRSYLVEKEDGKKINQIYLLVDRIFFGENKKTESSQEKQNSGTGSNNPPHNNQRANDQQTNQQNYQNHPQNSQAMNRPQRNRSEINQQDQQRGRQSGQTMTRPQQNRSEINQQDQQKGRQSGQTMTRPQQNRPHGDQNSQQQGGQVMDRPQQNKAKTNQENHQTGRTMSEQGIFGIPGMPMMSGNSEDYFDDFLNIPDGIEEELPFH